MTLYVVTDLYKSSLSFDVPAFLEFPEVAELTECVVSLAVLMWEPSACRGDERENEDLSTTVSQHLLVSCSFCYML